MLWQLNMYSASSLKNIIQPVCIRTRSPISINLVALFFMLDFFSVRIPSPFLHILSIIQSVHHHKSYVIDNYTPILSVLQTVSYIIYNIFPFVKKFFMIACFNYMSLIHNNNYVSILYCRQSMSYYKDLSCSP